MDPAYQKLSTPYRPEGKTRTNRGGGHTCGVGGRAYVWSRGPVPRLRTYAHPRDKCMFCSPVDRLSGRYFGTNPQYEAERDVGYGLSCIDIPQFSTLDRPVQSVSPLAPPLERYWPENCLGATK